MALDQDHWPTVTEVKASLASRYTVPPLQPALDIWFDFARRSVGLDMFVDAVRVFDFAVSTRLDGRAAMDVSSTYFVLNGYRFVLDQKKSTLDNLIWADLAKRGDWKPHWIVLDSIEADPIIADLSQDGIPIFFAEHGTGHWVPVPLFKSLMELIESIRVEPHVFLVPLTIAPSPLYTVVLTDMGPTPKHVLLVLKRRPDFGALSLTDLIKLQQQLPITLLENNVSESLAEHIACIYRECGATIEIQIRN